jgi:DNA sulfur modification protein DndD
MILERLVLHNFGVYAGRHVVELAPPSSQKPVVLLGGLNGGGKTTILDALQLALYGRMAHGSNRGDLGYEEYLRRTIHRGVDPHDGAALEIHLSRVVDGKVEEIAVRRSWSVREKHVRERVEVCKNGALDTLLTDGWAEHVEEMMPVRLSRFFFFDGEKIESLADLDRSADVLRTAVHVLLGLDVVDQLVADLLVIERRTRTAQKDAPERAAVEAAQQEVDRLRVRLADLAAEQASAHQAVDLARRALREAEQQFQLGGGDALAQKKTLEGKREDLDRELRRTEDDLREEAEGTAPLLLVAGLLAAVAEDDEAERTGEEARSIGALLADRDARTLAAAEAAGASRALLASLRDLLASDRGRYEAPASASSYLGLSREARALLARVREDLSAEVPARVRRLVGEADRLLAALDEADRKLASTPQDEAVESLAGQRDAAREQLAQAEVAVRAVEAEIERVRREHAHKSDAYARRLEKGLEAEGEADAAARTLTHAERARETMKRFRAMVLDKRVRRIESLVLEGFSYLLRKEALVSELRIDPKTFTMTLYGADRRELSPERLSAGERQLLAVSIIWALARASGRPLPVVIDTPLGRLDSIHREHLVERYFPRASHQVILLSTDEEIDERHFARLKPHIGRSYLLRHDDASGSTTIEPGYFF